MFGVFWASKTARHLVVGVFLSSLLLFLLILSVQQVNADFSAPDVECEENCTLISFIFYCDGCSHSSWPDKSIYNHWCCDPCTGCYSWAVETCVLNVYCGMP